MSLHAGGVTDISRWQAPKGVQPPGNKAIWNSTPAGVAEALRHPCRGANRWRLWIRWLRAFGACHRLISSTPPAWSDGETGPADLSISKINMHRSKPDLHISRVDLLISKVDLCISRVDLHTSKIDLHISRADLHISRADLHISRADLHISKADLRRSKRDLSRSHVDVMTIRSAPI